MALKPVQTPTRRTFELVSDDRPEFPGRANANAQMKRGKPEHYMPDLKDPAAKGKLMQPKFFLTSAKLPLGTPDAERRGTVAEWMTSNPWFATALVNRMWGEARWRGILSADRRYRPRPQAFGPKSCGYAQPWFRGERLRH